MERGGTFLEAPVCGSRVPALEGQLTVLTSGDRKLYDDCYSCFEAIGKKSFYLGSECVSCWPVRPGDCHWMLKLWLVFIGAHHTS